MLSKLRMRRQLRRKQDSIMLNLTPMIDVMTVLLAVFMVTAPLLTSGLDMKLPDGGKSSLSGQDQVVVSITKTGKLYIGERHLALRHVLVKVKSLTQNNPKAQIVLSADRSVPYGTVIKVMGAMRDIGLKNVGLQTDVPRK
ncbi:MAG: biopolymer transporter ExbD [Alphaproteobacteria bacterium]|nr:biopolymer transporter ExbD [Alphaproteobacteria bacterium]MBN2779526.1 biopolymer transporter ExbD [Alphaproteobacteria bacterium]